jgi:glycosyltransferase involved in cell wall biosynthesis
MRIAIDLTALMPIATGVDTSIIDLVTHLAKVDSENCYTLFVNTADRRRFDGMLGPNMTVRPRCIRSRAARFAFQQGLLPVLLVAGSHDIVHSPSFLMPLWRTGGKHLLTIHDLTFFSLPETHSRLHRSSLFLRGVRASIRRADMINVPSEATRTELLRWVPGVLPERVRVTPWGVHPRYFPAASADTGRHLVRLRLPRPYILHVGTIEPRKNLLTLLDGFRRLIAAGGTPHHLVLAGGEGWNVEEVYRVAALPELRGRVHFLGYVPIEDLPWLYRGASVFVYPSLGEGFGFPPLEAMACGVPVIASQGSSLEENLGGAAELVPASDARSLAAALATLLADASRREQLTRLGTERASSFRWERTAELVVECYRELAEQRR